MLYKYVTFRKCRMGGRRKNAEGEVGDSTIGGTTAFCTICLLIVEINLQAATMNTANDDSACAARLPATYAAGPLERV